MMKKVFATGSTLIFILANLSYAQLPNCDIWIADVEKNEDGAVQLLNPENITSRQGYDNQPYFTLDNKSIIFSSQRDGQTDIYEYNISSKDFKQLTNTPESEYSPMIMPDEENISIVKVDESGSQRLWKFPKGGGQQELVMKDVDSIGYYTWVNKDTVGLFILTDPPSFQIADINTQKVDFVMGNIGKGMQMYRPNDCLFFVSYDTTNLNRPGIYVYCYNPKSGPVFYHPLAGSNDFFCVSEIGIMMGENSIVYREFKDYDSPWVELSNLNNWGIQKISRIAISHDGKKAAIVSVN